MSCGHPPSWIFSTLLDHPRRIFGGLYCHAKFGWNACISFHDMNAWIFYVFGLKMPIHAPKAMGEQNHWNPSSLGAPEPLSSTPMPASTPLTNPNDGSIGSCTSTQLCNTVHIGYNGTPQIHPKTALPLWHHDPHLIHPSLDRPHSPSQTASGST